MIRLSIEDRIYHVEFRHTQREGKHPALGPRAPIRAITTCVIIIAIDPLITVNDLPGILFTAIGTALCANDDDFSRQTGRHVAFSKAVTQCGALRGVKMALTAAYLEHDAPPCIKIQPQLSQAEKVELWQAGWDKRQTRSAARYQKSEAARLSGTSYAKDGSAS